MRVRGDGSGCCDCSGGIGESGLLLLELEEECERKPYNFREGGVSKWGKTRDGTNLGGMGERICRGESEK